MKNKQYDEGMSLHCLSPEASLHEWLRNGPRAPLCLSAETVWIVRDCLFPGLNASPCSVSTASHPQFIFRFVSTIRTVTCSSHTVVCKPVFSNTSLAGQIQSLWQTACVLHEIEQNETSSPRYIQLLPWTFLCGFVPALGPEITNCFIQSYSQLIPYPPHQLCFAFHSSLPNGPLFNELKSCFQRSNTVFSTHVPSSTKTNSSGFEKRRVDSVEGKKRLMKGKVVWLLSIQIWEAKRTSILFLQCSVYPSLRQNPC